MRALRLTLAGDLAAAAGAVDADRDDVAADIVAADRRELADFLARSRAVLDEPARPAAFARHRRRVLITLPAIPLVGALAASAAAAMGVLPTQLHHHARVVVSAPAAPISSTFHEFVTVVDGDPSASQVVAAATALHEQIAALIATSPNNASGVREVAKLLQLEQALLMRKQPPGSAIVLAASRLLAQQLLKASPRPLPTSTSRPTNAPMPTPTSTATATSGAVRPSPTATSSHHTWQTPAPAPTSSSTTPPPSNAPAPWSSSPGHIITIGN